jgi:hypothetical protein
LVEPGLDPPLPVLSEVVLLDGVVVLCHRLYYFRGWFICLT